MSRSLMAFMLVWVLAAPAAVRAQPAASSPRVLLNQAIDLYVEGRYQEAVDRLRPLVESRVLQDQADQREALRTFGISLYLVGARPAAERAFRDLLRLDPQARLDPSFVRPEVLGFFESVRRQYRLELHEEVRKKGPKGYAVVNLLPPWGQFQNGHRTKGYILLGGELGCALTSIATAAMLYAWRDDSGQFGDRERAAEVLSPINWVSFGITAALVLYGVVDGLYYYYRLPSIQEGPALGVITPKPYPL